MSSKFEKRMRYVRLIRVLITLPLMFIIMLKGGLFSPPLTLFIGLLLAPIALYDITLPIYLAAFIAYWGFIYQNTMYFLFTTAYMVLGVFFLLSPTAFILLTLSYIVLLISPEHYWITILFIPLLVGLQGDKIKGSTVAFTAFLFILFICYGVFIGPLPILLIELRNTGSLAHSKPPLNTLDPLTIYNKIFESTKTLVVNNKLIVENILRLNVMVLPYALILPWTFFVIIGALLMYEQYGAIRRTLNKVFKKRTPATIAARCLVRSILGCLIIGIGFLIS